MTAKHGLWRYYQGHRYLLAPTPLNLRTSVRSIARHGQHKASGQTVSRDFGNHQRELPVCRKCRVPFGGPKIVPSRARWNGTDGGAG